MAGSRDRCSFILTLFVNALFFDFGGIQPTLSTLFIFTAASLKPHSKKTSGMGNPQRAGLAADPASTVLPGAGEPRWMSNRSTQRLALGLSVLHTGGGIGTKMVSAFQKIKMVCGLRLTSRPIHSM